MKLPDIVEKIRIARGLFVGFGEALRADASLCEQLRELRLRAEDSGRVALRAGVAATCRKCDEEEGGSCCGAGIENRYTPELLLMNILLGADLPESRYFENSCWFLGDRGCMLPARDVLCINYLCTRLQKELSPESLLQLQATTGCEMEVLFVLHNKIRNFIRQNHQKTA
jgi:hypothetical protein